MKKFSWLFLIALVAVISSCSSTRNLSADKVVKNTLWVNFTPTELEGQDGMMINQLYFMDNNKVVMKTGVGRGSEVIIAPILSNFGTYECSGNLKKGITVNITSEVTTIGKQVDYKGLITSDGMVLVKPDSTAYVYFYLNTDENK